MKEKKGGFTREQASKLYKNLKKRMKEKTAAKKADAISQEAHKDKGRISQAHAQLQRELMKNLRARKGIAIDGKKMAIVTLIICACLKAGMAIMEFSGVFEAVDAKAALVSNQVSSVVRYPQQFSPEKIEILKRLDQKRKELDERAEKVDEEKKELQKQKLELASQMNALRILTEKLRMKREQTAKKRSNRLEQLSKVYSSMNPQEAARLMDELDISIALDLIRRMPEKRIGQVLSLMNRERALAITKLLSSTP